MHPEFISIKEAAVLFACSEITIRRAIKKGYIIAIRLGAGPRSPYRISLQSTQAIHDGIIAIHNQISKK